MGLSGSVEGKRKEKYEYCPESQVNCNKLVKERNLNYPKEATNKMDINEISDLPSDVASESTLESEIDALSKIITDTKDDIHKLDDNDEVFKLDNDISLTDSLQEHCAKSNKCELIPDDGLAISDILDGTRELDNFISTSNVDSDLQEVLGETFETIEDSSSKSTQNLLQDQTSDQNNDKIVLSAEPLCINNISQIDANDKTQKSQSLLEDQPLLVLGDEISESLAGAEIETYQQSIEKIENSANDSQVDPVLNDYLSEFTKKDDSQSIMDETLDTVKEPELDSLATESNENKCIDQTDFTQVLSLPSINPNSSDILFDNQVEDNLKEEPSIETEHQKESKIEDLNILADEVNNCPKETDINEISDDTSIVQQKIERDEKVCESEEIKTLNQLDITEANKSSPAKAYLCEMLISSGNNDEKVINEDFQPIDESKLIDEIPIIDQLEKEENIEDNDSTNCQNANNLTETMGLQNSNEDKNENNVMSECNKPTSDSEISKNFETTDSELKRVEYSENDNVAEAISNVEDIVENIEEPESVEKVKDVLKHFDDQELIENTLNSDVEEQNIQITETIFEEYSNINAEIEIPTISETIESQISQSNVVEKDKQPISIENENQEDIESSLKQVESSLLITKDLSEDIVTLSDPLSDNIVNPISTEVKEMSEEKKISIITQEIIGAGNSDPDSDSQGLTSNILNEVEKDFNSDLNKLLEAKETVSEDSSNFDNSEILTSSDRNFQSLEEKSQDPLSVLDSVSDQNENEKSSPAEKAEEISFEESSQSPAPMQSDKFINDLYNSCMPDDTSQFSNAEIENIKESTDSENVKSALEIEYQQLMETDALENAAEFILEETQADKNIDEPSAEISELESAVKFLQESEQDTESSQVMTTTEGNSSIFVSVEDGECDNASEVVSDLPETTLDPIAISEAEIISEAAKLENEQKEKLELEKLKSASKQPSDSQDSIAISEAEIISEAAKLENERKEKLELEKLKSASGETSDSQDPIAISEAEIISEAAKLENERKEKLELEKLKSASKETRDSQDDEEKLSSLSSRENFSCNVMSTGISTEAPGTSAQDILQVPISINTRLTSQFLPKTGVLDERYKEPPKIEIPDSSKLVELPKSALLMQKQRLDSPDRQTTSVEPKIGDTPTKKDNSDKQQPQLVECENVGSPRIILKIAKSAIAECSEPRSPKSPKVRSSDSPNPEESPSSQKLGKIKLKLSKGGHPSIIPSGDSHQEDTWHTDCTASSLSPMGMKIKITKSAEASEEPQKQEEAKEKVAHKIDDSRKSESPIGMKIKLSKSGDASIVQQDNKETTQETTTGKKQDSPSLGLKIKLSKSGDASIIQQDIPEHVEDDGTRRTESPIGMKIKLSKSGDASVISNDPLESAKETIDEPIKRTDSPMGVKIKLAKNKGGSASIISTENVEEVAESSTAKAGIGMKIKLSKSGDASVIHTTKDDFHETTEQHFGMKIKLSKTGDPSIVPSGFSREYEDIAHRTKHSKHKDHGASQRSKDDSHLEMKIKLSKTGYPTIITPTEPAISPLKTASISGTKLHKDHADIISFKKSHSDVTIEPIKSQSVENTMMDLHSKRKEITIGPIESKKPKVDTGTKQMMPDISIQPVSAKKEHQQSQKLVLESNAVSISRQQMSVINQEISITQVSSLTSGDSLMGEHLKNALNVPTESSTPSSSDCEIIEAQPELIIVNENSNSSQDVMIIDEVAPVKAPKKRGRPRRNALPAATTFQGLEPSKDPLSLDQPGMHMQIPPQMQLQMQAALLQQVPPQHIVPPAGDGTERPRRTCRSQKSYAPPKRGRGRGRGKRKNEALDIPAKKPRMEQEFVGIEHAAKPVIALQKLPLDTNSSLKNSPELFRALNQPTLHQIAQQSRNVEILSLPGQAKALSECEVIEIPEESTPAHTVQEGGMEVIKIPSHAHVPSMHLSSDVQIQEAPILNPMSRQHVQGISDDSAIVIKVTRDERGKQSEVIAEQLENGKEPIQSNQNWLAPSIKKLSGDAPSRSETISSLTVIDEETRMSAESGSRSQTPARNMSAPGTVDTLVNEESQNSVLSTATTESERVKQPKNRRMEITLDPDEGPFTVDKIAEYEWPATDKVNEPKPASSRETFMIQEQISQYLGVKSFKRKYPDLKRRMVDMEERNFLRENALVSESMCDMGLTAVSSSEVLDIMCSDFPEQYEEYRKHMREKAAKEHSKKQKELSAAANAERNRIDLAEMAMQSAISWNSGFNKARQESRRASLDLQTFTVHIPRRLPRYDPARRGCNYPCALITGQYTDYFREYKPAELRYYPLNTVVYGPTRPNERKFDSQSEGSQSDSDSDSSSDDSSSTSSEGTQDTEGSQSTMDEVDMELALDPSIKCKMCSNHLNKNNRPETLIVCGTCNGNVHPSCIDLTLDMVPHIRAYAWQCTDCKTCAQCHDPADEDKMLFCDMCDRGYHIYCVGLRRVPQGRWHCQECAVCANCGSKEPGGANSDRNSVAQWQHEFKKGDKNTRVYVSTFCVPCSKLWRKGRYCPHCSRCHNATRLDQEPNLVHCGACDKYLHLECVETKGMTIDRRNYLCEFCSPNRQQLVKPLTSKTFKT